MTKLKTIAILLLIILISPAKATLIENVRCTSYCSAEGDGKYGCKGDLLKEGYCAADPRYFPYDTQLLINGRKYIVKDIGSAVVGKHHIDLFCNSLKKMHQQGTLYANVEVLNPNNPHLAPKSVAKPVYVAEKGHSSAESRGQMKISQNSSLHNSKNCIYCSKGHQPFFNKQEEHEILICDNE